STNCGYAITSCLANTYGFGCGVVRGFGGKATGVYPQAAPAASGLAGDRKRTCADETGRARRLPGRVSEGGGGAGLAAGAERVAGGERRGGDAGGGGGGRERGGDPWSGGAGVRSAAGASRAVLGRPSTVDGSALPEGEAVAGRGSGGVLGAHPAGPAPGGGE